MNQTDQFKAFLSMSVTQLPILFVCLVACIVIVIRWKQAPRGAMWALLGFSLALSLCIGIPMAQTWVHLWVIQNVDTNSHRASILTGLSLLWSVLRAATYALLLVAVFAGRATPSAASRPPLSQNESPRTA
jgi:hypothetical protein